MSLLLLLRSPAVVPGDPPVTDNGGWYGVASIMEQQRQIIDEYYHLDPVACPHDGTPLRGGPNGELYCPFDGWQWDGSPASAYPSVRQ
jgi:hypothetical protein